MRSNFPCSDGFFCIVPDRNLDFRRYTWKVRTERGIRTGGAMMFQFWLVEESVLPPLRLSLRVIIKKNY